MTPAQYAKVKALAADERTDPATREAAQRQVEKWRTKFEGAQERSPLHPGMRQSQEYQRWVNGLHVGKRDLKR